MREEEKEIERRKIEMTIKEMRNRGPLPHWRAIVTGARLLITISLMFGFYRFTATLSLPILPLIFWTVMVGFGGGEVFEMIADLL